jgi:serine/threonine protein kinase
VRDGAALETLVAALARAAEKLTLVHRAGFLHGDVKPANVIVEPGGAVTIVDLGLAAPWREGGTPRSRARRRSAGRPRRSPCRRARCGCRRAACSAPRSGCGRAG